MQISVSRWCKNILGSPERVAVPIMTNPGIGFTGASVFEAVTNGRAQAAVIKTLHQILSYLQGAICHRVSPPENIYAFFDALDELNAVTHTL